MPYRNAVGMIYDSGRYEENMDWAMDIADWKGFEQRRREAAEARQAARPRALRTTSSPRSARRNEQARITVRPRGPRRRRHRHAAERPGPRDELRAGRVRPARRCRSRRVKIILGDTDVVKVGGGSHSGRSMRHAATVFSKAAVDLIAKGKKIAGGHSRSRRRSRSSSTTAASPRATPTAPSTSSSLPRKPPSTICPTTSRAASRS